MDTEVNLEIKVGIKNIGKMVKAVRQEVRLDLETVSNESGIDYKFLYDLEEGQIEIEKIEIKNIRKLLEYLPFTYSEKDIIVKNLEKSKELYYSENNIKEVFKDKEIDEKTIESMIYDF